MSKAAQEGSGTKRTPEVPTVMTIGVGLALANPVVVRSTVNT